MAEQIDEKIKRANAIQDHIIKSMTETKTQNLSHDIGLIHSAIVEEPKAAPNKLPEAIFVTQFLPIFNGSDSLRDANSTLVNWIAIAGSPFSEVSIIDHAGRELYKVPAMYDSSSIDPTKRMRQTLADFISNYQLRKDYLPSVGQRYMVEGVADRLSNLDISEEHIGETQQRWDGIFSRYSTRATKDFKPVAVNNNAGDDEDLVY